MIRQIGIAIIAFLFGYAICHFTTKSSVTNAIVAKSTQAEVRRIDNQLTANQKSGDSFEKKRRRIDTFYDQLEQEAAHDAPHNIDDFELPADRLRRWRAANAGTFEGLATGESDPAATTESATSRWQASHAGGQSHWGSESQQSAGDATMRADPLDRD
jgi:hypothetical protein